MNLRELVGRIEKDLGIKGLQIEHPALDMEVVSLSTDSKACQVGTVFFGMPGTKVDGGDFFGSAIADGAIAAIVSFPAAQKAFQGNSVGSACLIPVLNPALVCAQAACIFNSYPSQRLKMIGVTGTNGKTTTTHLIEFLLNYAQKSTAMVGTLYTRWPGYQKTAAYTTPFPIDLQMQLSEALNAGCQYVAMEVSSHALDQGRALGCSFDVSVFTNLTQDHLDYHKTMDSYFEAKSLMFNSSYLRGKAVINKDDLYGRELIKNLPDEKVWTYSIDDSSADFSFSDLVYDKSGVRGIIKTPLGQADFNFPLVGRYNLQNLLAALGAVLHLGVELNTVIAALPDFSGVPGRMENIIISGEQDISVIVDYAHTPDGLESLLNAVRPFIRGKMICVFGCGGDRDREKRPQMGRIAENLADKVIVTSDNPRTENASQIIDNILSGSYSKDSVTVQLDRSIAIQTAIAGAKSGDGVIIAGKGHEDYQIIGTDKIYFDDREESRTALINRLSRN
jgi:UDP-N-acetylmuramoyl-L-alanyl-D-glutamate--2,6-diaminopimelate ligase